MLGLGRALGETIAVAADHLARLRDQAAHPRGRHHHGQRADRRPLRRGQRRPALRAAHRRLRAVPDHAGRQHARRGHRQPQPLRRRDGRMTTDRTAHEPSPRRRHDPPARRTTTDAPPPVPRAGARPADAPTSGSPRSAPGSAASALAWLVTQRLLPLDGRAVVPRRLVRPRASLVTAVTGVDDRRPGRRRWTGSPARVVTARRAGRRRGARQHDRLRGLPRLASRCCTSTSSPTTWPASGREDPFDRGGILHAIVGTLHRARHRASPSPCRSASAPRSS